MPQLFNFALPKALGSPNPVAPNLLIHTRERRYWVEKIEPMRRLLLAHGAPLEYTPGRPETLLTTVYVDTPEGTWSQGISPVKFRCRSYQDPELWWFELKRRVAVVVDKWRRPVAASELAGLLTGANRSELIEHFTDGQPLIPLFGTRYYRTAFQWLDGLRVTVDRDISFHEVGRDAPYKFQRRLGGLEGFVIEVKADGMGPMWLAEALYECRINEFSKSKRALLALRGTS